MKPYTVTLFGHREIYDYKLIDEKLPQIICKILHDHEYVDFLIGRQGEFDEYAASIIKRVLNREVWRNGTLNLVLPYKVANIEYYAKYYDDIIIPESLQKAHPKAAARLKNRYMVDASDTVVAYVRKEGGAYQALKYAIEQGKSVINIVNDELY